jgi:putative oxidoreductase
VGIKETLTQLRSKKIPAVVAWLVIVGQSMGSIALILGSFGRIAAGANFIIFAGALILHAADGWTMNWSGKRKVKALSIL